MEIQLPTDCGNSPRTIIVGEFVVNWAKGDAEAMTPWIADNAVWSFIGGETFHGSDIAARVSPAFVPDGGEVLSVVTHGRLASCDGFLETGATRVHFSHAFRFAGTTKNAKIAEVRSYLIETQTG